MPDLRAPRGVRYPVGLIVFCLFLCLCADRRAQRSQAIWIACHWRWIVRAWLQAKGKAPSGSGSISQSCLSRCLATLAVGRLAELTCGLERDTFADQWKTYVAKTKANQQARRGRLRRRITRKTYVPAKKLMPQYALDGKARAGCTSQLTGRTEIDVTLFCPETHQVLGHKTLSDKQGEPAAAIALLVSTIDDSLPRGVITGDAGITCPEVALAARAARHHYIFGIKGNAGKVFDVITGHPWAEVRRADMFFNEGHGRQEIRTIKRVAVTDFGSEEFAKYRDVAIVFQVKADVLHVKPDFLTTETRYFIGDSGAAALTPHEAITYIRDHWRQESFHWEKDAVLKEDASRMTSSNGSRALGILRNKVVQVGKILCGSVTTFVDRFSANPRGAFRP